MELLSAHRDPLVSFSEAMSRWHRGFQASREEHAESRGYEAPRCPVDRSPYWILHLLDRTTAPPPSARTRLEQADIDPSDLKSSDGGAVLMVTDASGRPLGFSVLPAGWAGCLGGGGRGAGGGGGAGGDGGGGGAGAGLKETGGEGDGEGAGLKETGAGLKETLHTVVALLRHCMDTPMSGGGARRPHTLRVDDRRIHRVLLRSRRALSVLRVALWPQALGGWGPVQDEAGEEAGDEAGEEAEAGGSGSFSMRWPPTRYCHACKKHAFQSQLTTCPRCMAVWYCSDHCAQADWLRPPADSAHERWCDKMAAFMSRSAQLADTPFSYAPEVTAEDFDLEHFLSRRRLDRGYWVHWSLLVRSPRYQLRVDRSKDPPPPPWLSGHAEPYGPLRKEEQVLLGSPGPHSPPSLGRPLVSWRQYCVWRGLSLSSPCAPLLSSPLSIYYIITSLVPRDFPELNILKKQSLKIHIIESCREFHTLLLFWELSVLLPHVTFELAFIGERLPLQRDEEQLLMQRESPLVNPSLTRDRKADRRSIRVKGHRRAYHTLQGPKPDLVIGFRPMIPVQESWLSTLPRLQSLRVPAYFCESSELSCELSLPVMTRATGGALSPPRLNPFHCPLRVAAGNSRLPNYSNAFIFHLIYKPAAVAFPQCPAAGPKAPPPPANQPANQPQENPPKLTRKERRRAARHLPRKRK